MHRQIATSAAQAWAVLGERFGDLSWATGIESSSLQGELGVGAVRTCRVPPSRLVKTGAVQERLIAFDREAMTLAYEADLPPPMRRVVNRWSIIPLDTRRCEVRSHATVPLRGLAVVLTPLLRTMLRRMGHRFVSELAQQARQQPMAGPAVNPAAVAE